jgi:hypothetical protein
VDPTPDPTPFFSDFKDARKMIFFPYMTYPKAHYLQSLIYCFKDVFEFYFASIISVRLTTLWEGSGSVPLTNGPDLGGLKTSGSSTLVFGSDHGLYESMPSDMRGALCGLWVAVVENNHKEQYSSVQQFSAVCESHFHGQRHF